MKREILGFGAVAIIALAGCSNEAEQGDSVSNLDCAAIYSSMIIELNMQTDENATEANLLRWIGESKHIMPANYYIERAKQEMGVTGSGSDSTVPFSPLLYERMAEIAESNHQGDTQRLDELLRTCEARYHPNEGRAAPQSGAVDVGSVLDEAAARRDRGEPEQEIDGF